MAVDNVFGWSPGDGIIECMFDSDFAAVDDNAVIAAIEEGARAEAAAAARRLAAIAELARRRVDDDDERANWAFDGWDSAAAEVAAAMTVGQRRASGQMRIAVALRDRLPCVAALYMQGLVSSRVVAAITWRTQLVEEPEAIALIDAALAEGSNQVGSPVVSTDSSRRSIPGLSDSTPRQCGGPNHRRAQEISVSEIAMTRRIPHRCGVGCWPPMPRFSNVGWLKSWRVSATTIHAPSPNAAPTRWEPWRQEHSDWRADAAPTTAP